jgi:hypothetical protein
VADEERGGKRPHLGAGRGVHRQLPHLGDAGQGVHRGGNGTCAERLAAMKAYMQQLADRLRNVRVCCGDWTRVMGPTVTFKHGVTGIILDPPYSAEAGRNNTIYTEEDTSVAHDVRAWCIENGGNPLLRIALCGYEGEHDELESLGWAVHAWKSHGGYGLQSFGKNGSNRGSGEYTNKFRERVWFSRACRPQRQLEFAAEVW